jgi:hypothetical protein
MAFRCQNVLNHLLFFKANLLLSLHHVPTKEKINWKIRKEKYISRTVVRALTIQCPKRIPVP